MLQNILDWREYAEQNIMFFKRRHKTEGGKAEKYCSSDLEPQVLKGKAAEKEVRGESPSIVRKNPRGAGAAFREYEYLSFLGLLPHLP